MGNVYTYIPYMDAMGMETAGVFVFLLNQLIASTFWKEPFGRSLSFFSKEKHLRVDILLRILSILLFWRISAASCGCFFQSLGTSCGARSTASTT